MKTYLFYDIETSGLNKAFDQVLQYAACRLDENFNVLEEHHFRVRPNYGTYPSPEAMCVHGIAHDAQMDEHPEVEVIDKIHLLHNEPGTWSGGYNTLGFDDEFLRFSFYRNLLNPYSHQFANQCGRFDIYPMVPFFYAYAPEVFEWPTKEDGKVSLKLDDINQTNNWLQGSAHDALHDVKVTIHLAEKLKAFSPEKWQYLISYFDKAKDLDRVIELPVVKHLGTHSLRGGIMISGLFGKSKFVRPVLYLGAHHHYRNQGIWMLLDEKLHEDMSLSDIIIRKKFGEPPFILPAHERFGHVLSEDQQNAMADNFNFLDKHVEWFEAICKETKDYAYPVLDDCDSDAALYQDGFRSRDEYTWCQDFHHLVRVERMSQFLHSAPSPQLKTQAARILYRNHLPDINDEVIELSGMKNRGCDYRGDYPLTPELALERALNMRGRVDAKASEILESYIVYLQGEINAAAK